MKRLTLFDWFLLAMLALLLASFAGCASLPPEQRAEEAIYQALHGIDTLQTLQIHNGAACWENNPILGRYPSQGEIYAYMASEAVLHAIVTQTLADHDAPMWVQRVWEVSSVVIAAGRVRQNHRIGVPVKLP